MSETNGTNPDSNVTRHEIASAIAEAIPNVTTRDAAAIMDTIIGSMCQALKDGSEVKISGFGKFTVKSKKERKGRNPQTGEPVQIAARKVLRFRLSEVLKGHLNDI